MRNFRRQLATSANRHLSRTRDESSRTLREVETAHQLVAVISALQVFNNWRSSQQLSIFLRDYNDGWFRHEVSAHVGAHVGAFNAHWFTFGRVVVVLGRVP